jgi:hypothetical protein
VNSTSSTSCTPTNYALNPHLPEKQRLRRIRIRPLALLNLAIPLRQPPWHLNIVIQNHLRHNHLNLVGREEPPGARVPPVPEHQVLLVGRDELVARVVRRAAVAAQVVVAEAVELLAVGP